MPSGAAAVVPLIEITRGGLVESIHCGVVAAVDASGALVWSVGDPILVTFPRSSLKPFQLLAFIERGGAERFQLQSEEIAILAGSHGGEPMHLERVSSVLSKIGAPTQALACGAHPPLDAQAAAELRVSGARPSALHNNCSGKHAGMLGLAILLSAPLRGYLDLQHPVQVAIRDCLVDVLHLDPQSLTAGVDGCSAPAYAMSLQKMARGFALLAAPEQAPARWAAPLNTIRKSMQAHPQLVGASVGRLDTALMALGRGLVAKSGAEGYFAAGHPGGVGLTVKIMDGDTGTRSRHSATVAAARHLAWLTDGDLAGSLAPFGPSLPLLNAAGLQTGELRPAAALRQPSAAS